MEAKELKAKLNAILEAIAAGHSCEQIVAADRSLSSHDLFHAITEAAATYPEQAPAGHSGKGTLWAAPSARTRVPQRAD